MPRLFLFLICLTVLGFSISAKVGLVLGAVAAVVWCGCAVVALGQLALPPPVRHQRRRR